MELENFKMQKSFSMEFGERTVVRGRNRTGKTTIADAITWCLFGKDSKGRAQFAIKTRENGVEIPHLDHSVTLTVEVDGVERIIKRVLQEKWVKPHGMSDTQLIGHNTLYFVDGEKLSQRDFQTFISEIISEDKFHALTIPSHFPNLPWQTQREMLTKMCGDITIDEVIELNPAFEALRGILKEKSTVQHLEHLNYLKKEVVKTLDQIPVRISELTGQKPEKQDWDNVDEELKDAERDLRMGSGGQSKLDFAERRAQNIRQSAAFKSQQMVDKQESDKRERQAVIDREKANLDSLKKKLGSFAVFKKRCRQTLEECEQQKVEIRNAWAENGKSFSIDESDMTCPTCRQPLPASMLDEKIEKLKTAFNERKASVYEKLTKQAANLKAFIEETQRQLDGFDQEEEETQKMISESEEKLARMQEEPVVEIEETEVIRKRLLGEDQNYQDILKEIETLKGMTQTMDDGEVKRLQRLQAQRDLWLQLDGRITQLRNQQVELNKQLSKIEQDQDLAKDFQQMQGDLLERKANALFGFVKFRLFRQLINGSVEPYCEATVGGIPYSSLNSADQINAGIDIINALSRQYDTYVPLVIDNAESINEIIKTESQKILLYVAENDRLEVTVE